MIIWLRRVKTYTNFMLGKIVETVRNFVLRFLEALRFAVLEYDAKLQVNKSPWERVFIWVKIVITFIVLFSLLVLSLKLVLGF